MTQRREVEGRLALYDDLSGILGAMRSFALTELHRVTRREAAQQAVVQTLTDVLPDVVDFLPPPYAAANDIWLLLGSVRGFCGSFNEDVIRAWRDAGGEGHPAIVAGERLVSSMPDPASVIAITGAESEQDATAAIDRMLAAIAETRGKIGEDCGLVVCIRDEEGGRIQRLLPLPASQPRNSLPPLMNEPAAKVALGVAEHFLFHMLLAMLLRSIRVENHMRLMQMENALRHLEKGSEDLQRQRNRMRQEEIVEEIELMTKVRPRR